MSAPDDLYAVLGVPAEADAARIRAAYLALVQQHHPDRCADAPEAAEARTKEINAAFAVLGDPHKRALYDQERRAPAAAVPARRTSPEDLRRAANQRTRVLARGAAISAGALVAVGAVVAAHATGHPPRFSLDRFERAPAAAGGEGAATALRGVMLPWPDRPDGPVRASGLTLSFGEGRLEVRDAAGGSAILTLPKGAAASGARYGIGRLDPESSQASVIVAFRKPGEPCCSEIRVAVRTDEGWRTIDLGARPGPPLELFPAELDGDGVPEFVLADRRFLSAFGPPAQALFPQQILQIRGGRVVDASDSGRFHTVFRQEMEAARPICALGSNSACAAFVANAARVGRLQWAWSIMLDSYDPDAAWPLPAGCAGEAALGACPSDQVREFRSYPAALSDFLRRTGYAREAPLGLGDVTRAGAPGEAPRPRATPARPGSG